MNRSVNSSDSKIIEGRFTGTGIYYMGSSRIFFVVVWNMKMVETLKDLVQNMAFSSLANTHGEVGVLDQL